MKRYSADHSLSFFILNVINRIRTRHGKDYERGKRAGDGRTNYQSDGAIRDVEVVAAELVDSEGPAYPGDYD